MHIYQLSNGEILKLLFIVTVCLISGCSQKLTTQHDHSHTVSTERAQSKNKVLNCSTPSGHHVYKHETICPIDGEKFESLRLGTHSKYGRHLDWEPVSYMRFPTPIPVCPTSGFVVAKSEYSDAEIEAYKKVVTSKKYTELYTKNHASYFLYAKTLELSNNKSPDQWWLYLNATWEADNCEDEAKYKEYANLVIQEGKIKLSELNMSMDDYWVINIVIPNLYRRLGDFSKAEKYLNKLGVPSLEEQSSNEFFTLAIKLLKTAIADKSTKRIPIK